MSELQRLKGLLPPEMQSWVFVEAAASADPPLITIEEIGRDEVEIQVDLEKWDLAVALAKDGTLERYGVELIGADLAAIEKAEDRDLFKQAMERIGVAVCPSGIATSLEEAEAVGDQIGSYPRIIRPAFTLGGSGGGIAYNPEEFRSICLSGLDASPVRQILIEQSLLGWKEFELITDCP